MFIPEPLHGEALRLKLKEKIVHEPLIEGFLYKNATLMISSQPGVGKSVLSIEAGAEMSMGKAVFSTLAVIQPLRVWYIQMERPDTESLERIQLMFGDDFQTENFYLDTELQALNFLKETDFEHIIKRGEDIKPDVIIIDPLYGIAPGLSKDEVGSNLAKMLTILKKHLNCALWINHHTTKNTYEIINHEKVEKEDPFYGAQWIKAHVTGSYIAKLCATGLTLSNKKDSHSLLIKELNLVFDPDTYLSTMSAHSLDFRERCKLHLNTLYRKGLNTYHFDQIRDALGCAPTTLREFHRTPGFEQHVIKHKYNGKKTLYEIVKPF